MVTRVAKAQSSRNKIFIDTVRSSKRLVTKQSPNDTEQDPRKPMSWIFTIAWAYSPTAHSAATSTANRFVTLINVTFIIKSHGGTALCSLLFVVYLSSEDTSSDGKKIQND
jgi:hypothetical protein